MLTRTGWLVAAGAAALVVAGRLLGVDELFLLGTAAGALLVVAAAMVNLTRLELAVHRDLHPGRVPAGTPSRVELQVRNRARRRTPVLRLHDPVSRTPGADLLTAPLDPGERTGAAYRLPTDRRGIVRIGPLRVLVTDPFGLAVVTTTAAGVTDLTVYPRTDDIAPVPHTASQDPHAGSEHPNSLTRSGEDFYALRDYVVGDDLRRVHWPSTARHGELMVRQDELPWQARVTILLDVRRAAHTAASLELAVSAAASVATASWRRGELVRLVTTDGTDSGFAAGHLHAEGVMEHLATVQASPLPSLQGVLNLLGTTPTGGALVAVTANAPRRDLEAMGRLRRAFGSLTLVRFEPSSWGGDRPAEPLPPLRGRALSISADEPFATVWNRALRGPRGSAARVRMGA
ncbi:DUF58 domain-containing protein [soil metagenome]